MFLFRSQINLPTSRRVHARFLPAICGGDQIPFLWKKIQIGSDENPKLLAVFLGGLELQTTSFFGDCFNWMIPNHYIKKWLFHQTSIKKLLFRVPGGLNFYPVKDGGFFLNQPIFLHSWNLWNPTRIFMMSPKGFEHCLRLGWSGRWWMISSTLSGGFCFVSLQISFYHEELCRTPESSKSQGSCRTWRVVFGTFCLVLPCVLLLWFAIYCTFLFINLLICFLLLISSLLFQSKSPYQKVAFLSETKPPDHPVLRHFRRSRRCRPPDKDMF